MVSSVCAECFRRRADYQSAGKASHLSHWPAAPGYLVAIRQVRKRTHAHRQPAIGTMSENFTILHNNLDRPLVKV